MAFLYADRLLRIDQTERLSVDALREVFEWLALIDLPDRRGLGWIVAAHTCTRWRRILLDIPNLWAAIVCVFETEESFAALVHYAKNRPVRITTLGPYLPPWARTWALANLHRVEILADCLDTLAGFEQAWDPAFHNRDLPALRELSLIILGLDAGFECYRPPAGANPLRAPSLRRLRLRMVQIPFYAPSLTHLQLTLSARTGHGMLVSDLLASLEPCLMLEEVDLVDAVLAGASTRQTTCHLPRLKRLSIQPTASDAVLSFMSNMFAPALQFLQWRFPLSYDVLQILSTQAVRQFLACPDFDTLRIRCERDHDRSRYFETCLGAYSALMRLFTSHYDHYPLEGEHNGLRLCMDEGGSAPDAVAAVSDLSAQSIVSVLHGNQSNIRYIHLSIAHNFPSTTDTLGDWATSTARVLAPCRNVTQVEVSVDDTDRFSTVRTLLNPPGEELIFPRLTQLVSTLR